MSNVDHAKVLVVIGDACTDDTDRLMSSFVEREKTPNCKNRDRGKKANGWHDRAEA